jgi:hypothetical protein
VLLELHPVPDMCAPATLCSPERTGIWLLLNLKLHNITKCCTRYVRSAVTGLRNCAFVSSACSLQSSELSQGILSEKFWREDGGNGLLTRCLDSVSQVPSELGWFPVLSRH